MALGHLERKKMEHLKIPLSEKDEAILELMKKVNALEHENQNLKDEIKRLQWSLTEQD
jgi:predicted RNase H-like nuclease (RuvC/YqgF family)